MTEPRRLLEGGGTDWERELLDSAGNDVPADLETRTLSALGLDEPVGGGSPPGAGEVAGTAATGPSGALLLRVGALAIVGAASWLLWSSAAKDSSEPVAVVGRPPVAEVAQGTSPAPVSVIESEAAESPVAAPAALEPSSRLEPKAGSSPGSAEAAPPPAATAPAATATPSAAPSQVPARADTLAKEVAALDRARKALAAGNGAGALVALGAYDREFPRGMMRSEAQLLRVRAHLASGNRAAASALGKRLIAANPDGFHAKQIRKLIGESEPAR